MKTDHITTTGGLPGWVRDHLPERCKGIWVVGGTVRDMLTGRRSADIDLVVDGDIARAAGQIADRNGGSIVDMGKKGFAVLRVASPEAIVDITPLTEPSIEANLRHRDFTINALAYDIQSQRLVDCTGGLTDMRSKTLRLVSPTALLDDPARLVRAYRLAATLQLSIDADTEADIGRHCHLIANVAGERIWAELYKLFQVSQSAPVVRRMARSGLLTAIFPEMQPAIGCAQNQYHSFDVFEHSLQAYAHLEDLLDDFDDRFAHLTRIITHGELTARAAMLKYACLLHDVGKPDTRTEDGNGQVHFYGHAAKSAVITASISRRLRLSNQQRDMAEAVIRHHIRPLFLFLAAEKGSLGRRGMVRFFKLAGNLTVPVVVHTMADIMAKGTNLHGRDRRFIEFCDHLLAAYDDTCRNRESMPPLINGRDLIAEFDLSPSPLVGHLLSLVDEGWLSGDLTTRDQALVWVADYLKAGYGKQKAERPRNDGGMRPKKDEA